MQEAVAELTARALVTGGDGARRLTGEGCAVFQRLAAARRERLAELFADWPPEKHEELAALLRRFLREMVPDAPAPHAVAPAAAK
jgi:hypothetical protein